MSFLRGMTQPWVEHQPDIAHLDSTTTLRILRGKTLAVNVLAQTIDVELSWKSLGNGRAVSIPLPKFMPGWALQPEREFTCKAPATVSLAEVQHNPCLLSEFGPV